MSQPNETKPTYYEAATAIQGYSPEDYWFFVEGYLMERRRNNFGDPHFPDYVELEQRGIDIEILARQLYDGADPELFGKALVMEGSPGRINTVLKIGNVEQINAWFRGVIERAASGK